MSISIFDFVASHPLRFKYSPTGQVINKSGEIIDEFDSRFISEFKIKRNYYSFCISYPGTNRSYCGILTGRSSSGSSSRYASLYALEKESQIDYYAAIKYKYNIDCGYFRRMNWCFQERFYI